MKKTIISLFVSLMAIFMIVSSAQASFNSPGAMSTITVTNASTSPCSAGSINGCWKSSTTARPGDVIAVHIYYKNTGSTPEQGIVRLSPSRNGTAAYFSGSVSGASGSASVTLTNAQPFAYMTGSNAACWQTSANGGCRSVDEDALFGSGFSVGTVNPGEQGVIVARFLVSNPVTPPTQNYQCNDGIDNDGDRLVDYPSDPGCSSPTDNNESNSTGPSNDQCEIDSFTVDGRSSVSIDEGDSALLRWNTTDCDYVRVTSFSGNLDADSTATARPTSDKTYTLTAYPNGGTATVRITVDEDDNNNSDQCDIDSFKASRTSIDRGQSVTLSWKVTGADRVEINGSSKSKNSSMSVSPYSTTTYRLVVEGNGCEDEASIRINVNDDNNSRPQAITTIATIFGSTSAQLNGIAVPNIDSGSTTAWFEWGVSSALGYRTGSKSVGSGSSSVPYGEVVNGLVPGTTYYYRAVVENKNGTAYGSIVSFRTTNSVQGTTVVTQPTRVIVQTIRDSVTAESTASLLELRVESAYDHMCVGGEMEYVVSYRNISALTLEDTVLRIALPKELTYTGANRGNFDAIDNIVTLDIGRVQPGEEGTVTVRARVNEYAVRGNLTVMTATVVYTNPVTRAQEDAIAYSLITVSDECPTVLGASVVGFGSFLPDTLLEWLLLILVILALILIGRNLYKKKEEQKQV
ncbi:DUF11 domain-containing protein [Patescibacteria group bacterium]|nr:DUF11 domain-containing protein [Patescibacteria group bacterium]